jgi:succinoglycan biosynthesis transport protein ExoP
MTMISGDGADPPSDGERRRRLPSLVPRAAPPGSEREQPYPFFQAPPGAQVDLTAYGRSLLRRRWTVLATLAVALAIGAAVTLLTRPVYTAEATLQIDRENEKVVSRDESTPQDNFGEEFYETQYGLLRGRSLAVRVAQTQGLLINDDFIARMKSRTPSAAAKIAKAGHGRLATTVALLRSHEDVVPERGSRLTRVEFSSPDPELSARIANAYAENFIEAAMDRRYEASSYARDFLEKRLAQVKAKLEESEQAVVGYAASQHIVDLSGGDDPSKPGAGQSLPAANLQAYNTALSTARTERIKAQERWEQARTTVGAGLTEILQNPTMQQLTQERAKLAAEYQDKLSIFKPDYPDMRQLSASLAEIDRQIAAQTTAIKQSLHAQYAAALDSENALQSQVATQQGAVLNLRGRSIRYTILQREVDTNRTLYDGLLQRYKEVGVAGGVAANNISIVDRAVPPIKPSRPEPLVNMALAAAFGLGLGVFLALLRDALDQAIRTPFDIESDLDLPMLGAAPVLKRGVTLAEALADNRSALAEAYQSLRSALQFSTANGFPKTLLITSPWPGGGKSTTASALARYVARLGFRVLLVDADLRNPSLHRVMDASSQIGLTNLLTGSADLAQAVQTTAYPDLFLLTCGPLPPNPAELLAGQRLQTLISDAAALFDMVIFDGPPTMALADAPTIGSKVEATLMVVEANKTTRTQVRAAMRRLDMAGAHVLGVVLTRYRANKSEDDYGYGYGYEYGPGHADPISTKARAGDKGRRGRIAAV